MDGDKDRMGGESSARSSHRGDGLSGSRNKVGGNRMNKIGEHSQGRGTVKELIEDEEEMGRKGETDVVDDGSEGEVDRVEQMVAVGWARQRGGTGLTGGRGRQL
ncbi:hypothetical protein NDU88_003398 [Pleurodeles waltl]|uniref:Uncharacterized protein n=1 Tax=Pleurodeles waltl TaxID=8319 RepID=A0AAV7UG18_PLEWA|nr:hypothetical protein NDU88_003398 [Pleurodeles waltl]